MAAAGQFVRERIPVPCSVPEAGRLVLELVGSSHDSHAENAGPMTFRIVRRYRPTWATMTSFLVFPLFVRKTDVCRIAVIEARIGAELLIEGVLDPTLHDALVHLGRVPEAARVATLGPRPVPQVLAQQAGFRPPPSATPQPPPPPPAARPPTYQAHRPDADAPVGYAPSAPAAPGGTPSFRPLEPAASQGSGNGNGNGSGTYPPPGGLAAAPAGGWAFGPGTSSPGGVSGPGSAAGQGGSPSGSAPWPEAPRPGQPLPAPSAASAGAPMAPPPVAPPPHDFSAPSQAPGAARPAGGLSGAGLDNPGLDNPGLDNPGDRGSGQPNGPQSGTGQPGAGQPGGQQGSGAAATSAMATRAATIDVTVDSGETSAVGPLLLVGRAPSRAENESHAKLLAVNDPSLSVSKTHLALGVDPAGLWVVDRRSTNGTWIDDGRGDLQRLEPGQRTTVPAGARVLIGERVLTFSHRG